MLAGNYLGLSRVLDTLQVDTEVEFVGWGSKICKQICSAPR